MTSIFDEAGKNIPCTVIEAGPCVVTHVKSVDTDGYAAVQLAYGEKKEEAIIEFPKSNIPANMKLEPGMKLQLRDDAGHPVPVIVTEVKDEIVILDANHELAGKELIFDIELVQIGSKK